MTNPKIKTRASTGAKTLSKATRSRPAIAPPKVKSSVSKRSSARVSISAPQVHSPQVKKTDSKQTQVLSLLNEPAGATIEVLMRSTGWLKHSVRGFLSSVVRKKLGLNLLSAQDDSGRRVYRVVDRETSSTEAALLARAPNNKTRKAA